MFFRKPVIKNGRLIAHYKSYKIESLSEWGVKPVFRAPAIMVSFGLIVFTWSFSDLLKVEETIALIIAIIFILGTGWNVAQLKLLSRDLKNTEESIALWGFVWSLQNTRQELDEYDSGLREQSQ